MNITKLITRSSIALLALFSASAFAGAPPFAGPDFTIHKATVKFKLSTGIAGDIEKETLKNKDMIELLGGDSDDKDQELALVVACDDDDPIIIDSDVVALMVVDKDTGFRVHGTGILPIDLVSGALKLKNGDPKKLDTVGLVSDIEIIVIDGDLKDINIALLTVTGTVKFGKIGKKIADENVAWDKDEICVSKLDGKSAAGFIDEIEEPFSEINVMDGKVSAGKAKAGRDCADDVGDTSFGGLCIVPD
jgi:hypothetical protein